MAIGKETAALLFKITGDTSDASGKIAALDNQTNKLSSTFSAIGSTAGIVASAFAAIGAAALATGAYLFNLARETAEYGSRIKDAADKTGLAAETVSALKIAADQSGSSLEAVSGAVVKFSKLVGDAAEGSKEAKESLIRLGVDPQEAMNDLDGALEKVFKRILDGKEGVEQTKLATEAFGRSGADLLPVIKSFDGDIGKLIERVRKLGVLFDQDAANAADDFGDSLDTLELSAQGVGMTVGKQILPELTLAMQDLTEAIVDNREAISSWASSSVYWSKVWAKAMVNQIELVVGPLRLLQSLIEDLANFDPTLGSSQKTARKLADDLNFLNVGQTSASRAKVKRDPRGDGLTDFGAADAKRKALEDQAKRDSAALLAIWKNHADEISKIYDENFARIKDQFEKTGDAGTFRKQLEALNNLYLAEAKKTVAALESIENDQATRLEKTGNERLLLQQEQTKRNQDLAEKVTKARQESEKLITDTEKKENDERLRLLGEQNRRKLELMRASDELEKAQLDKKRDAGAIAETEYWQKIIKITSDAYLREIAMTQAMLQQKGIDAEKRAELENRIKVLGLQRNAALIESEKAYQDAIEASRRALEGLAADEAARARERGEDPTAPPGNRPGHSGVLQIPGLPDPGSGQGPFDGWRKSWEEFLESFLGGVPTLTSAMQGVGQILQQAFAGFASALGQVIQNWVLYGETGPAVMRKILASALATIAAEAAVRAIYAAAYGFLMLAFGQYDKATNAFIAAAVFGSIAVGAAVAGRAVAGNAFRQESSRATSTGANTQGSRSGSGGAYSGQDEMTVNGGRNASAGNGGVIVIRDRSGMFDRLFETAWESNGPMRQRLVTEFSR